MKIFGWSMSRSVWKREWRWCTMVALATRSSHTTSIVIIYPDLCIQHVYTMSKYERAKSSIRPSFYFFWNPRVFVTSCVSFSLSRKHVARVFFSSLFVIVQFAYKFWGINHQGKQLNGSFDSVCIIWLTVEVAHVLCISMSTGDCVYVCLPVE